MLAQAYDRAPEDPATSAAGDTFRLLAGDPRRARKSEWEPGAREVGSVQKCIHARNETLDNPAGVGQAYAASLYNSSCDVRSQHTFARKDEAPPLV